MLFLLLILFFNFIFICFGQESENDVCTIYPTQAAGSFELNIETLCNLTSYSQTCDVTCPGNSYVNGNISSGKTQTFRCETTNEFSPNTYNCRCIPPLIKDETETNCVCPDENVLGRDGESCVSFCHTFPVRVQNSLNRITQFRTHCSAIRKNEKCTIDCPGFFINDQNQIIEKTLDLTCNINGSFSPENYNCKCPLPFENDNNGLGCACPGNTVYDLSYSNCVNFCSDYPTPRDGSIDLTDKLHENCSTLSRGSTCNIQCPGDFYDNNDLNIGPYTSFLCEFHGRLSLNRYTCRCKSFLSFDENEDMCVCPNENVLGRDGESCVSFCHTFPVRVQNSLNRITQFRTHCSAIRKNEKCTINCPRFFINGQNQIIGKTLNLTCNINGSFSPENYNCKCQLPFENDNNGLGCVCRHPKVLSINNDTCVDYCEVLPLGVNGSLNLIELLEENCRSVGRLSSCQITCPDHSHVAGEGESITLITFQCQINGRFDPEEYNCRCNSMFIASQNGKSCECENNFVMNSEKTGCVPFCYNYPTKNTNSIDLTTEISRNCYEKKKGDSCPITCPEHSSIDGSNSGPASISFECNIDGNFYPKAYSCICQNGYYLKDSVCRKKCFDDPEPQEDSVRIEDLTSCTGKFVGETCQLSCPLHSHHKNSSLREKTFTCSETNIFEPNTYMCVCDVNFRLSEDEKSCKKIKCENPPEKLSHSLIAINVSDCTDKFYPDHCIIQCPVNSSIVSSKKIDSRSKKFVCFYDGLFFPSTYNCKCNEGYIATSDYKSCSQICTYHIPFSYLLPNTNVYPTFENCKNKIVNQTCVVTCPLNSSTMQNNKAISLKCGVNGRFSDDKIECKCDSNYVPAYNKLSCQSAFCPQLNINKMSSGEIHLILNNDKACATKKRGEICLYSCSVKNSIPIKGRVIICGEDITGNRVWRGIGECACEYGYVYIRESNTCEIMRDMLHSISEEELSEEENNKN